jgi:hypothetical protein
MFRAKSILLVVGLLVLPSLVFAQAELAGVARDTTGAVLPGVTVEARSPVLIEGVRASVTDGSGQYRIIALRPGEYTVTFSLPGFSTVVQEGVLLSGTTTTSVNANLAIGGLEETITVTSEAPVVDISNVTRTMVLDSALIDSLPTVQRYAALGALIPGATPNRQNPGGANGDKMASLAIHGGKGTSQRILMNGVNTSGIAGAGHISGVVPNANSASEIVMDTSAPGAEMSQGGVRINYIPRDGGNVFSASVNLSASGSSLYGDNFTQRLQGLGLRTPDTVEKIWNMSGGFGGPILRDKIWFWWSGQDFGNESGVAGSFYNRNAFDPNIWTYEADTSRPGVNKGHWYSQMLRLTTQATPRNKIGFSFDLHDHCRCPDGISSTRAPEAAADRRFPHQHLYQAEWTAPISNRLLVELVGLHRTTRWGNMQMKWTFEDEFNSGKFDNMIAVQEQTTGLRYRNRSSFNSNFNHNYFVRGAISYITGSHSFKVGFTELTGELENTRHSFVPYEYRLNKGVPNRITQYAYPDFLDVDLAHDFGLFAQDRWTLDRMTLNYGIRYDYIETGWPAMTLGPAPLVPNRNLAIPESNGTMAWKDLTYRLGAAYDLFGNGRTALRASANKYLEAQTSSGLGNTTHPTNRMTTNARRSWNDADGDFVPDCDLTSTARNGECGPMSNSNFGSPRPATNFDPDLLKGWGKRGYDWEFAAGIQHEVLQGVSVDLGYFRRIYGNFRVTDNRAVTAADFDQFSVVAPTDSRLPSGGGQTITGLYNVNPAKFGKVDNLVTLASNIGTRTQHWNGVDLTMNARLQNGLRVQGGFSTGRQSDDSCALRAAAPETALTNPYCNTQESFQTQFKMLATYTIPTVDVLVSGSFQSYPGREIAANARFNNVAVSPSLGRNLAGGASNVTVNLVEPDSLYNERLNQLDVRFGKVIRVAGARASINLDVYNLLNKDTITGQNNNFGAVWMRPSSIILARFAQVSATFDF